MAQKILIIGCGYLGTAIYERLKSSFFALCTSFKSFVDNLRTIQSQDFILIHTSHVNKNEDISTYQTYKNYLITEYLVNYKWKKYIFLSSLGVYELDKVKSTCISNQHNYNLSKFISEFRIRETQQSFLIYRLDRIYDECFRSKGYISYAIRNNKPFKQYVSICWLRDFLDIFEKTFLTMTGVIDVRGKFYTFEELKHVFVNYCYTNKES